MTKLDTITFEYAYCGECPHVLDWLDEGKLGHRCGREGQTRLIPNPWSGIPDWCPLPDKEEKDEL